MLLAGTSTVCVCVCVCVRARVLNGTREWWRGGGIAVVASSALSSLFVFSFFLIFLSRCNPSDSRRAQVRVRSQGRVLHFVAQRRLPQAPDVRADRLARRPLRLPVAARLSPRRVRCWPTWCGCVDLEGVTGMGWAWGWPRLAKRGGERSRTPSLFVPRGSQGGGSWWSVDR